MWSWLQKPTKLCRDCRYVEWSSCPLVADYLCKHWQCQRPGEIDVVTGQNEAPKARSCWSARYLGPCGLRGKLWTPALA